MEYSDRHPLAVFLLALACAACGPRGEPASPPPGESARYGAALAYLTVENQTDHRVAIVFRPAAGAGGEVGIGDVDPGAEAELAPIPAGEAILLFARVAGVGEYGLAARSFDIGQRWTWIIPADAQFRRPGR